MGGAWWEGMPGKWEDLLSLVQIAAARGRGGCWARRCFENITEDWIFHIASHLVLEFFFVHSFLLLFSSSHLDFRLWVGYIYGLLVGRRKDRWLAMAVALDAVWLRVKNVCKQNGLLIMSVLAVVIGCLLGFFLRTRRLTEQVSLLLPLRPVWLHAGWRWANTYRASHWVLHLIYCIFLVKMAVSQCWPRWILV